MFNLKCKKIILTFKESIQIMNKIIPVLGLLIATSTTAYAQNANTKQSFDTKQIYFGAGLGLNDASGLDSAIGFQVFAGLPLNVNLGKATTAVEVGYMDSGNMTRNGPFLSGSAKATGIWSTAVVSLPLQNNLNLVGRLGYDFGDDDGVMIGGGLGVAVANKMEVRFEYVIRDHINSLQANLVIHQ